MNKIYKNVIIVFAVIMAYNFLLLLVLPKTPASMAEGEKRTQMPKFTLETYLSGEFATDFSLYFSENFPFREDYIKANSFFHSLYGIQGDATLHTTDGTSSDDFDIIIDDLDDINSYYSSSEAEDTSSNNSSSSNQSQATSSETSSVYEPGPESSKEETSSKDNDPNFDAGVVGNGILITDGRAMGLYGSNPKTLDLYSQVIRYFEARFSLLYKSYDSNTKDITVYNCLIPTAIEFYLPEKYKGTSAAQEKDINLVYDLNGDNIVNVDAYSMLEQHKDEYIYFRTDHHWTSLGAYYAYTAFCEAAGLTPTPLNEYTLKTKPDFTGSMYRYTADERLKEFPDSFEYRIPLSEFSAVLYKKGQPDTPYATSVFHEYASGSATYSVHLGGDFPLDVIKTNNSSGKKILIVKESFGNAFAPYLIDHYSEIHVVDQRYFEKDLVKYVYDNSIDEVIFLNNLQAAGTNAHVNWIYELRNAKY